MTIYEYGARVVEIAYLDAMPCRRIVATIAQIADVRIGEAMDPNPTENRLDLAKGELAVRLPP